MTRAHHKSEGLYFNAQHARENLTDVLEQQRCRPACPFAQSDQRLRYCIKNLNWLHANIISIFTVADKTVLSLWSEPHGQVFSRWGLYYDTAHEILVLN